MPTFSYSFNTADTTAPVVSSVQARDLTTIRVTFDEAMGADALDAASYALSLVSHDPTYDPSEEYRLPAVRGQDIVITSVAKVAEEIYDLTVDMEPTPGALYLLTTTASDDDGNSSSATATFVGYQPPVDDARFYDYLAWLPDISLSVDETEDLRNVVLSLQEVGELLLYEADAWPDILDPDVAPEPFVDAMLADLGYPFEFELTETDKRRLAKILRSIYKLKGTDVGIINTIRLFLGIEVTITTPYRTNAFLGRSRIGTDWVLSTSNQRDLYTFVINVQQTLTDEEEDRINKITAFMRRAPCHWRIEAPVTITEPDHWALGLSGLGVETYLHG